jgi:hypothetical protein
MRWFVFFLVLSSLRLSGGEAGEAALALMQNLRDSDERSKTVGRLGISESCGPRKMESIRDHWNGRLSWAEEGQFSFALIEEKVDGDLAGVLIGATTPRSPDLSTVILLALVRKGEEWRVGPLEGSFDNTGLGFGDEVRDRARQIEIWMNRRQIDAASELQMAELQKFMESMEGAVPEKDLREHGAKEALASFIEAAEKGNTNALIVWQGYRERDEFPAVNWQRNLRVTRLGVAGEDRQKLWRLLTSRKVMKVILNDNDDPFDGDENADANILVGFLSSFETGTRYDDHLNPVRFPMRKTKAGWRVGLPVFFSLADEEQRAFRNAMSRNFDYQDLTEVRRMFRAFEGRHKEIRDEEAKTVIEGLLKDISTGDMTTFLRRNYRYVEAKKKDGEEKVQPQVNGQLLQGRIIRGRGRNEPDEKRKALYFDMVKWWNEVLGNRNATEAELSGLFVEGKIALGILSLPPSADTWKPVYQKIWLGQGEEGWMILPGRERPSPMSYPEEEKKSVDKLMEVYAIEEERISEKFLQNVLKVVALDIGKGDAAEEAESLKMVKEWRRMAREGGMIPLLKLSAVRKLPEKAKTLLREVGYLRKGAASAKGEDEILGSKAAGRFRAVSVSSVVGQGNEMQCPLFFVVPVEGGHRVLVDIELPLEVNRGISLLNEDRIDELSKELPKEDFQAIKELREWHQKTARPVWEKWNREQQALDR